MLRDRCYSAPLGTPGAVLPNALRQLQAPRPARSLKRKINTLVRATAATEATPGASTNGTTPVVGKGVSTSSAAASAAGQQLDNKRVAHVGADLTGNLISIDFEDDGGPPRFFSPYVMGAKATDPALLPFMLYLPGIDGTGLAASLQFKHLVTRFDLRSMYTPASDRTPFLQQVELVRSYLEQELQGCPADRPVYLLGESYGGVLALVVAAACTSIVDRVVLVNPATSFPRSPWPQLGPLLLSLPREAYPMLPILLAPVLGNPLAMAANVVDPAVPLLEQLPQVRDKLLRQLGLLGSLADILPPDTLRWKLDLMQEGNAALDAGVYSKVQQRVLVVTAENDFLIPSAEEGPILKRKLPRATVREVLGSGHAVLQESGTNLIDILDQEGFYTPVRRLSAKPKEGRGSGWGDAALPVELPTDVELDKTVDGFISTLRRVASPVFLSTTAEGRVVRGLAALPDDRPCVFVGNHQLLASDMYLMIEQFLRERRRLPRGLAHPVVFGGFQQGAGTSSAGPSSSAASSAANGSERGNGRGDGSSSGGGGNGQGFSSFLSTFGAVPVGGFNFYKLLAAGEDVLLYPGGVREAYHNKGEQYSLFWPDKPEFVRMAAKFGATIVPFGAIGCYDSLEMLADSKELRATPLLGPWLEQQIRGLPMARRGASDYEGNVEDFIAPLCVPKPGARFYYKFGEPIRTSPDDLKDKGRVAELYSEARLGVEGSIEYLLEKRDADPYGDLLPRLLFETTWGKPAPTFSLD